LRIKGTTDLIVEIFSNFAEIVDWKTGECKDWATGKEKKFEDFCIDPQLLIYYLAMREKFPYVQDWSATMHYVRTAGPFTVSFSKEDIDKVKRMLKKRFDEIRHCKKPNLKESERWFCKTVCSYGKTASDKNPDKTICQYIHEQINKKGIDYVVRNETADGFNIGFYQNPGE
jgi:hypothetical protein